MMTISQGGRVMNACGVPLAAFLFALLLQPDAAAGDADVADSPPVPRAVLQPLAGLTLNCVDYGITFSNNSLSPWNTSLPNVLQISTLGDGFSRVKPNSTRAYYAYASAPLDTAVPVAASDMDGANIWMLNQLAQEGNFSINFFLYKLPPALVGAPDATAVLSYLLGTKGYDCITTGVQVTAARGTVASFLTPTEAYGYVAVYGFNFDAFIVAIIKDDIAAYAKLFFFWVVPFSTNVWRLLFVSLTVVGIVMCILERRHNEENFPDGSKHGLTAFLKGIWNGVYYAFAGFVTKTEEFAPKTLAGRILGLANAFAVFLYIALYVANLTAILTSQTTATVDTSNAAQQALQSSPIKGISSYSGTDYRPCTQTEDGGGVQRFMSTLFSTVKYVSLPFSTAVPTVPDLLYATLFRECGDGAILPSKAVEYWTSALADPDGYFCGIEVMGAAVTDPNSTSYAIAFAPSTASPVMDGLNALTTDLVFGSRVNSSYYLQAGSANFPAFALSRPQCTKAPPPSPPLSKRKQPPAPPAPAPQGQALATFSGVFIVQAIGIVAGLFLWLFEKSVIKCGECMINGFEACMRCCSLEELYYAFRKRYWPMPADDSDPRTDEEKKEDEFAERIATHLDRRASRFDSTSRIHTTSKPPPPPEIVNGPQAVIKYQPPEISVSVQQKQSVSVEWGLSPQDQVRILRELAAKLEGDIERGEGGTGGGAANGGEKLEGLNGEPPADDAQPPPTRRTSSAVKQLEAEMAPWADGRLPKLQSPPNPEGNGHAAILVAPPQMPSPDSGEVSPRYAGPPGVTQRAGIAETRYAAGRRDSSRDGDAESGTSSAWNVLRKF